MFWTIVVAVFFANVLTVLFVYGMISYVRLEKKGQAGLADRQTLLSIFLPLFFLAGGLGIVLGY